MPMLWLLYGTLESDCRTRTETRLRKSKVELLLIFLITLSFLNAVYVMMLCRSPKFIKVTLVLDKRMTGAILEALVVRFIWCISQTFAVLAVIFKFVYVAGQFWY